MGGRWRRDGLRRVWPLRGRLQVQPLWRRAGQACTHAGSDHLPPPPSRGSYWLRAGPTRHPHPQLSDPLDGSSHFIRSGPGSQVVSPVFIIAMWQALQFVSARVRILSPPQQRHADGMPDLPTVGTTSTHLLPDRYNCSHANLFGMLRRPPEQCCIAVGSRPIYDAKYVMLMAACQCLYISQLEEQTRLLC